MHETLLIAPVPVTVLIVGGSRGSLRKAHFIGLGRTYVIYGNSSQLSLEPQLSAPKSRDIAITIAAIPCVAQCLKRQVSAALTLCDAPSWHLLLQRHICAMSHFATYHACDAPKKQAENNFAILSPQVAHDMESIAAGAVSLESLEPQPRHTQRFRGWRDGVGA